MAFDAQQQAQFDRQIHKMQAEGFFLPEKRSLSGDTRYLFVSYGGTGAAALFGVKKTLENALPEDQLTSRVRFLAIDTDQNTQKYTKQIKKADGTTEIVELDSLDGNQFFHLAGNQARLCLSDAPVQTWINPQLRANIKTDMSYLDGNGASGIRQLGRLTLYPSANAAGLTAKIQKLAGELTHGNAAPLRVFIFSGIAGGTGSGTVIDLTYLIRNTLENMPGALDNPGVVTAAGRTKYSGFILLPPTGNSTDPVYVSHGNRNGYAALKEINHFMTLNTRGGEYKLTYGNGNTVQSGKNIFDVCYLLDGTTSEGVAFANPREEAVRVLSESVLDMITASQVDSNGNEIQTVDSFMSDASTMRTTMIANKSIAYTKRDADYLYCALGHSEFAMPTHEIKAYVGKQMFDRIYDLFQKCGNVEESDVNDFLKDVIRRGTTKSAVVKAMDEKVNGWFTKLNGRKGGPYFVINLLHDVVDKVEQQYSSIRLARIGMASNETLGYIKDYASHLNHTLFNVYTAAMEALKGMMNDQYNAVVQAGVAGNVYTFFPTSMGEMEKSGVVIQYLNGLISSGNLISLTDDLLNEMLDKKEDWTALINGDNPTAGPNAMRRFWNDKLNGIIQATMEDFLIKYYSGNPDAHYDKNRHADTIGHLEEAAQAIYNQMLGAGGSAQPMVGLTANGMQPSDFNAHTYLMVPKCASNLSKELKKIAANAPAGQKPDVCESFATDRISCYKQYASIPAFKLSWVCSAETDYEKDLPTVAGIGTHMSETAGGNQWKTFPNLLPKSTWPILPYGDYVNSREDALAQRAETLFTQATDLKLTSAKKSTAGANHLVYSVKLLPDAYRPGNDLFRDLDRLISGSAEWKNAQAAIDQAAESAANTLFGLVKDWRAATDNATVPDVLAGAGIAFGTKELVFSDSVLTVGTADEKPADWDEYMAKCMLRKLPDTMSEVSGTVMVMEKLMERVNKSIKTKSLITLFAQYLVADMFKYNEELQVWQYPNENGFPVDLVFIANEIERASEYYRMFIAFRNNPDPIIDKMKNSFTAKVPVGEGAGKVTKTNTFLQNAKILMNTLAAWNQESPIDAYATVMNAAGYNVQATKNFYQALYMEVNTMSMVGYQEIPGSVNVKPAPNPGPVPGPDPFLDF